MANVDVGNFLGVSDRRHGRARATTVLSNAATYDDVSSLRTRLSSAGYTARTLDVMTRNDMVYAVRKLDDNAGIR